MNEVFVSYLFRILSVVVNWLPTILGIVAIVVAKNSLDFSKRSSLVKESYEPILYDLKINKKVAIVSSEKLNFKILKSLKESYLYNALEKNDRRFIESIIEKGEELNSIKEKAIEKVEYLVIKYLDEIIGPSTTDLRIGEIIVEEKKVNLRYSTNIYENLFDGVLFYNIISKKDNVYINLGYFSNDNHNTSEESFIAEESVELLIYLNEALDFDVIEYDEDGNIEINSKLEVLENKILEEYKREELYKEMILKSNELQNEIEGFHNIINKRIKKLLIPNYWLYQINEYFTNLFAKKK